MIEHEKTILFKGFDINQFLRDFSLVRLPADEREIAIVDILIFINIIHQANRHVHSGLSLLCNDKQIEAAYHDNEGKDYLYIQM